MAFTNPEKNLEALDLTLGLSVVDIGAGSGAYAIAAAKLVGDNGKVYAIDVQKELLAKLKNEAKRLRMHNIEIIWADAEKLGATKLRDGSVDAVILSNVLFQVEDKKGTIAEAKRILKSGGKGVLIDWTDSFGGLGPQPKDVFPKDEAGGTISSAGLTLVKEFDAGDHHYGLVFRK